MMKKNVSIAAGLILLLARPAYAADKADCAAALKAAQAERTDGKLLKASVDFATCARPVCPAAMQKQCSKALETVAASQPTVVFAAKDASDNPLTNVTVTVDGSVVTTVLDGKPVPLDPGTHPMRFEMEGATPVIKDVVVVEGARNQKIAVDLDFKPPAAAPPPVEVVKADPVSDMFDTNEDPTKRYYFIGMRYTGTIIPQFMLNIFVNGGKTLYSNSIGLQADIRKDGFSIIPSLTYTEYGTGNIVFEQKGNDPTQASNWSVVNSSLKGIYGSVDLLWSVKINPHFAFEYGAAFGLGFIFGDLQNNWVYPQQGTQVSPTNYVECQKVGDNAACQTASHSNATVPKVGGYTEASWLNGGSKPNVFPLINFPQIGLRYKPIKQLETRFAFGFSLTGFFFGLSGNYGLETMLK
jgi:hypothetical protein